MSESGKQEGFTHFGYQQVPEKEKAGLVAGVFHSVAAKYDIMNDLMSLGVHRLWKRFTLEQSGVRQGQQILDVAGGTGDLAGLFAERVGASGSIVIADINNSMLGVGRDKLANQGIVGNIEFVQANAEALPFPEDYFDCISIGFGLRNVTNKDAALASMYRCLKPGGALLILEFSQPTIPGLSNIYDAYSFKILPFLGRVVADDEASYRYLAESIRKHPDQESLKAMMQQAGFERCHYFNLAGGIVALHKGYKF